MIDIFQSIITSFYNYNYNAKNQKESFLINPSHIFLRDTEIHSMFVTDHSCREYLSSVDSRTWLRKTGFGNSEKDYIGQMSNFSEVEQKMLIECLVKLPRSYLLTGTWKFAKTSSQIELGMPFTLGDIVFIPPDIIAITSTFCNTLCHERMHILQRQYRNYFNTFIEDQMGFTQIPISGYLSVVPFANPDGPQSPQQGWIFKYKTQWYYPILIMTDIGDLERVGVEVDITNWSSSQGYPSSGAFTDNIKPLHKLLSRRYPTCPKHHLYHPYEILAELGAMYVTDGTTGDHNIDLFYGELESKINLEL